MQQRCTVNPQQGRSISRGEHEELIEALQQRMQTPAAKELYRLRRQTVELVNADWKEHRKLRRFSGRGLERARCQVGLVVLAHNLLTLLSLEKAKAAAKPSPKREVPVAAKREVAPSPARRQDDQDDEEPPAAASPSEKKPKYDRPARTGREAGMEIGRAHV